MGARKFKGRHDCRIVVTGFAIPTKTDATHLAFDIQGLAARPTIQQKEGYERSTCKNIALGRRQHYFDLDTTARHLATTIIYEAAVLYITPAKIMDGGSTSSVQFMNAIKGESCANIGGRSELKDKGKREQSSGESTFIGAMFFRGFQGPLKALKGMIGV